MCRTYSSNMTRSVVMLSALLFAWMAYGMSSAVLADEQAATDESAVATADDSDAAEHAEDSSPVADEDKATADADESADGEVSEDTASTNEKSKSDDKPQTSAAAEADATDQPADTPAARKRSRVRLALLTVKDSLPETSGQAGLFADTRLDLRELVNRLDRAAKDDRIAGVVLDIRNPSIGRGKIEELRSAIARYRASGKKVYAQLESAMPADYLVATACDEIFMPEAGMLVIPGVHAEATFYKGLLGKLGLEADFVHVGPYKGAAEPLMRDKFSKPVRENMTAVIDCVYDEMVTTLVKDRPLSVAQAKEIVDTGLLTATRAKELGLIDRVAYADAIRAELASAHDAESLVYVKNYGQQKVDTDFSGPMGFFKLMQAMMGSESRSRQPRGKKIAVVYAVGPIVAGRSESDLFGSQTVGASTIVEALRKAARDDQVAAIVLRIDSPGGSALASDLIWHETQVIEKPIVASMGDVAASGGYYIAMGADKIIAAPGTLTGSIGVVGGKLAIRGLYDKIGITTETIERGRNSGLFSASGKFTDSQREVLVAMMEDVYRQFTTKAAEGRKMELADLEELAGGRIYTGRQAKEIGLVDQLGTLHDAIREAKLLAGIDADEAVRIEVLPEPTNFLESLLGGVDAEEEVRLGPSLAGLGTGGLEKVSPELVELARKAARLRAVFDQPAALIMPFELEIR